MVEIVNYLVVFYIFFGSFTLLVCGENNILPNLNIGQESELVFFGPLESEPLKKKLRAGAAKK